MCLKRCLLRKPEDHPCFPKNPENRIPLFIDFMKPLIKEENEFSKIREKYPSC